LEPITREEKFLLFAAGEKVDIPEPVTRIELFLSKIAGMDIILPDPFTRKELYLAKISGENVVLPKPYTRDEKFLAKAAGYDVETPKPYTRMEYFLEKLSENKKPEPIEFHVFDGDKLIIRGAMSAISLPDGLYLDCSPDWEYPVLDDDVLNVTQVYSATPNGDTLEVE
jgi:hypothetical protein